MRVELKPAGEGVHDVVTAGGVAAGAALIRPELPDLVWIYRSPLPESQKIAGLACFCTEKVDLYFDGVRQ